MSHGCYQVWSDTIYNGLGKVLIISMFILQKDWSNYNGRSLRALISQIQPNKHLMRNSRRTHTQTIYITIKSPKFEVSH